MIPHGGQKNGTLLNWATWSDDLGSPREVGFQECQSLKLPLLLRWTKESVIFLLVKKENILIWEGVMVDFHGIFIIEKHL